MSLVLSVDVGTTNVKASLVNNSGTILKVVRRPQEVLRKESRAAEHGAQKLIDTIISCCKEAISGRSQSVSIVSISTYQYGLVILDDKREPISNISTLLDTRSRRTFDEFLQAVDILKIYEQTGCPAFIQSILPRLFYFKKNKPDLIKQGKHFLSSKAWIMYKFTGQLVTEPSTESPSQFMDIRTCQWSQSILDIVGVSVDCMPDIIEPMDTAFDILPEIRKAIGLPDHCKMIPGVYDGGAICLGMNCNQPETGVSNIGTSGMLRFLSTELVLDDSSKMRYQPFYLMNGKYLIGGATNNAALPLKWFRENLLELDYDEIDKLAQDSPVGSNYLFFMPYLTGERDINIGSVCSGSFFGLREYHKRADFVRSILEGVAFNLNMIKESMTETGLKIKEVNIGGGGVRSANIWVDILTNVLNLPLVRSHHEEPCLVGNAIMGFTYLGVFSSLEEAGDKIISPGSKVEPHPDIVSVYDEHYQFFKELYTDYFTLYKKHANFSRKTVHSKIHSNKN